MITYSEQLVETQTYLLLHRKMEVIVFQLISPSAQVKSINKIKAFLSQLYCYNVGNSQNKFINFQAGLQAQLDDDDDDAAVQTERGNFFMNYIVIRQELKGSNNQKTDEGTNKKKKRLKIKEQTKKKQKPIGKCDLKDVAKITLDLL